MPPFDYYYDDHHEDAPDLVVVMIIIALVFATLSFCALFHWL